VAKKLATRVLPAGSVVDPPEFMHASVVDRAFDDLVTQQRKHSAAQEQRSRVSIPINARRTALIVNRSLRLRTELAYFAKL
jgi:hypothetical protein